MRRFLLSPVIFSCVIFGSCNNSIEPKEIQNSNWLLSEVDECNNIYSFRDSTVTFNSCEMGESFNGKFWIKKDSIFILIPKHPKKKVLVGGDSVEVYTQRLHRYRPTLKKLYYKNDSLFFFEIYDNYLEKSQTKFTDFEINYLTRIK